MAERLLNNLIAAVTNLRDNPEGNNNTVQNGSARSPAATTSETTEGALRRLYPSIDQPPVVRNNIPEDRSTVNNLTRFNPSIDYRPRKGKKILFDRTKESTREVVGSQKLPSRTSFCSRVQQLMSSLVAKTEKSYLRNALQSPLWKFQMK